MSIQSHDVSLTMPLPGFNIGDVQVKFISCGDIMCSQLAAVFDVAYVHIVTDCHISQAV